VLEERIDERRFVVSGVLDAEHACEPRGVAR
jgi:hypothetical protein